KIDPSTKNASRFWYITGTKPGGAFETQRLQWSKGPLDPDPILAHAAKLERERTPPRPIARTTGPSADAMTRARQYAAKCQGAISGSGGHNATWLVTVALVRGFDLSAQQAYRVLAEEFNPRCKPPWSERELRHKVTSAMEQCKREPGYLLAGGRR